MNTGLPKQNKSTDRGISVFLHETGGNDQAGDTADDLNDDKDLALDVTEST